MSQQAEQRSEQWFEDRRGRITASAAGAFLDCHPYMTREDAIRRMVREYHGAEKEFDGNVATDYGEEYEAKARGWFEWGHDAKIEEVGFFPLKKRFGASPDGLVHEPDGSTSVLEIKCPYGMRDADPSAFKSLDAQPHYYAQVQMQMLCTGSRHAYFVQWCPQGGRVTEVALDQAFIDEQLMPALEAGYEEFEREKDNPAHLEPLELDMSEVDAWRVLESSYTKLTAQKAEIDDAIKRIKEQMIELSGGKKARGEQLMVFPVTKSGSISYAKAIKELAPDADLEAFRGKPTTSYTIREVKQ